MIAIKSNGSKWAGESPDSIEKLIEVLSETPLDRSFENYGNFIIQPSEVDRRAGVKTVRFFGNFLAQSHVFNIDSDEPAAIAALTKAIRDNQQRADYLSQHKAKGAA